ncbi:MAG: DinB family protein [Anaerolineales bacterium]|nr:DinB family protein [Anaerolineales bacterium]
MNLTEVLKSQLNLNEVVKSQYLAALEMLKQAVTQCPAEMWDDAAYENRFWHVAYHALFYVHLYLQPTEADFVPWEKHKKAASSLSTWGDKETAVNTPYTPAEVLEYLALVQQVVLSIVDKLDMHGESGFSWLPFNKLELQFYNIRHIQHHAGELYERLNTHEGTEVDWVGLWPDYLR